MLPWLAAWITRFSWRIWRASVTVFLSWSMFRITPRV